MSLDQVDRHMVSEYLVLAHQLLWLLLQLLGLLPESVRRCQLDVYRVNVGHRLAELVQPCCYTDSFQSLAVFSASSSFVSLKVGPQ